MAGGVAPPARRRALGPTLTVSLRALSRSFDSSNRIWSCTARVITPHTADSASAPSKSAIVTSGGVTCSGAQVLVAVPTSSVCAPVSAGYFVVNRCSRQQLCASASVPQSALALAASALLGAVMAVGPGRWRGTGLLEHRVLADRVNGRRDGKANEIMTRVLAASAPVGKVRELQVFAIRWPGRPSARQLVRQLAGSRPASGLGLS